MDGGTAWRDYKRFPLSRRREESYRDRGLRTGITVRLGGSIDIYLSGAAGPASRCPKARPSVIDCSRTDTSTPTNLFIVGPRGPWRTTTILLFINRSDPRPKFWRPWQAGFELTEGFPWSGSLAPNIPKNNVLDQSSRLIDQSPKLIEYIYRRSSDIKIPTIFKKYPKSKKSYIFRRITKWFSVHEKLGRGLFVKQFVYFYWLMITVWNYYYYYAEFLLFY